MATIPYPDAKPSTPNNITVVQEYHAAYNAVIQPDKYVACSRYFIRRWMPELGGTGVQIVLALRSLGFHNPTTGETRNEIEINLLTLAEMIKVHPATIKREFLRNKALALFVAKDSNYRRDPVTGQVLRAANIYRVMMDDPLHDADLPKLQEILDAQEKVSHRKVQNAPNTKPDISRKAQNAIYSVQSAPNPAQTVQDSVQSAPCRAQNAPTLKDYSYSPKINKITEEHTAVAASDFSPSLSQIAEQKQKEPVTTPLTGLVTNPVSIPVSIPVPEKPEVTCKTMLAFRKMRREMSKEWFIREHGRPSNEHDWMGAVIKAEAEEAAAEKGEAEQQKAGAGN